VIDFTSSLYLGLRHASTSLQPWAQLTAGVPAALRRRPAEDLVSRELSALVGCETAIVTRSSLHAFWDYFGSLSRAGTMVHFDDDVYASARWGIQRARARGIAVRPFSHLDARSFLASIQLMPRDIRPVVVTDGFCPGCGRPAPLEVYQRVARERQGVVIIDDTQAIGVLGTRPSIDHPYGRGGGGTLRFLGLSSECMVVVASLAKAFGAPLCMVASDRRTMAGLAGAGDTRVHSSPPSMADLGAARRALTVNAGSGDLLRARLARRVELLRDELGPAYCASTGLFPIQAVRPRNEDPRALHARMLRSGIDAVLHAPHAGRVPRVSLIVTADHLPGDIRRAAAVVRTKNLKRRRRGAAPARAR
jgi:8-amino-7-oxononanoate synthase